MADPSRRGEELGASSDHRQTGEVARLGVGVAVWGLLIVVARLVGLSAVPERLRWPAFPLYGDWMSVWSSGAGSVVVIVGSSAALAVAIHLGAERLPWPTTLVASWFAAAAFMAVLASDGTRSFGYPLELDDSYRRTLSEIPSLSSFVRHFVRDIDRYPIHTRGHPPGAVVLLGWLGDLGIHSTSLQLAVLIGVAALVAPSVAVTCRAWVDEATARASLPFVTLAPAAVWAGVSMDGVFAAASALAIASIALASTRSGRSSALLAFGSGVWWATALHLSYGLTVLAAVTVGAVLMRRRFVVIAWAALGLTIGTAPWLIAGFRWWDGLSATHEQYFQGLGGRLRPPLYYATLGNPALTAIMLGPVVVAALFLRRPRAAVGVIALGLGAMLLADVSGLSKAEVERIWVPFAPWVTVGAAALPRRWRPGGLALTVTWGVLIALSLDFVR